MKNVEIVAVVTSIFTVTSPSIAATSGCGYLGRQYSYVCLAPSSNSGQMHLQISRMTCTSTRPPVNCRYVDSQMTLTRVDSSDTDIETWEGMRLVHDWSAGERQERVGIDVRTYADVVLGELFLDGDSKGVFEIEGR